MVYTSVHTQGDLILYRGIENNRRRSGKYKFQPSLFCSAKSPTEYKTIGGKYVEKLDFLSIKEAKDFIARYKDVDNFEIFGNQSFEYVYISNEFPDEIDWKFEDIVIANIDIEVASENGFPAVETATEALQAITVRKAGRVYAFGCQPYDAPTGVIYTQCDDEYDLIEQFLSFWESDYVDVVTGWYVKLFDIPYLVNRITKLVGEDNVRRLSPWGQIRKREVTIMKRTHVVYTMLGISTLDYLELYRKFAPNGQSRENYKLDYICHVELNEQKLSYEEYGSLHLLYKQNFQKFMDYNVHDTYLVEKLDKRLQLLRLAFKLAYHAKCNFDDVFMQTRMWDCLIYNHLLKENIVLPAKQSFDKEEYVGAWVKEPKPGKYKWVVSFDFTSLYPKLMMQYNLSSDTILNRAKLKGEISSFVEQNITIESLLSQSIDTDILKKYKVGLTPNKQLYSNEYEGFLPKILRKMFNDRVMYKKEMKRCQKELEKTTDPILRTKLEDDIAMYDCFQQSIKICINSCYGALGNQHFRLFDVRIAEAVTTSGQLAIHWVITNINNYLNKLLETKDQDYTIAADTDSMYITLDKLVEKVFGNKLPETQKIANFVNSVCDTKLSPFIEKSCQALATYTNAFSQEMEMKREKICFEPQVQIETHTGRKPICKINVGDLVLTHKNRYRHVTQVMKNKNSGELIHIQYGRTHEQQHIRATPNHPILIERNGVKIWTPFKDVATGDYIFLLPNICEKTGKKIPYWCKRANTWNAIQDNPSIRRKKKSRNPRIINHPHMINDILPFCEQKKAEGWQMIPVGVNVIPDAIGIKNGKITAFEIEKTIGITLDWKKKKYENSPILNWIDNVEWIELKQEKYRKENRSVWFKEDDNGFIKVKVLYTKKVKSSMPYVYNIEVDEDHSYVAAKTVVHNCDVAVIVAKKRYIWNVLDNEGVRYNTPKVSIVGLETKRSNVPQWAKSKIAEAIGYIINDDEDAIHNLIETSEIEFMKLPIEDLASPTGMNGLKDHSDPDTLYKKGTPAHVKGSLIYNEFLKRKGLDKKYPMIKEGEKVKYVYLKQPNPIHYDVIAFSNILPPEFELRKYINYDMMFKKVLVDPIKGILDVIGWKTERERGLW